MSKLNNSFSPNKWGLFVGTIFFGIGIIFYIDALKNPNSYDVEDPYIGIIFSSILFSSGILHFFLLLLKKKFPKLFYLGTNESGIIYKTLFSQEKIISWNKIEKFYIISEIWGFPLYSKFVKIKFKSNYKPSRYEKNLLIPGNPEKVLKILNKSLSISKKKSRK